MIDRSRDAPPSRVPSPSEARHGRLSRVVVWCGIIAAAAALRTFTWPHVFTVSGVHLTGDDDAVYHVLRTERMLAGAPGAPWRDPSMNFPVGAEIPWPPGFDGLLAAAGWVAAGGAAPTRADLEMGGAILPVALGLATLPIVAGLAALLAGAGGVEAALMLALLPAHATFTMLGRSDQHALEVLIFAAILLVVASGVREPSRGRRWAHPALAFLLAAGFWTWLGAALYPLILVAFAAGWFAAASTGVAFARRLAGDLAAGGFGGAALLAVTVAAARGPGALREMSVSGLTGLQPLLLAMTGAFGVLLLAMAEQPGLGRTLARRVGVAAAAAALPAAGALLIPGAWDAAARGLAALARSNAWYRSVQEFNPLLGSGWSPLSREIESLVALYGLVIVALPFAAVHLARRLRDPLERAPLALLLALVAMFALLGFARVRFALYLTPLAAIAVGSALRAWSASLAEKLGGGRAARAATFAVLGAVLVGPAVASAPQHVAGEDSAHAELRMALAETRRFAVAPGRPGILTEWADGHLAQYATGRPVVASPFGTEGGEGAMEDSAAFFLSTSEDAAEAVLARRGVGLIVLHDPTSEMAMALGFAPPGTPPLSRVHTDPWKGPWGELLPASRSSVTVRLHFWDGAALPDAPGLAGFRLLSEGRLGSGGRPEFKIFGVVPGALLAVAGATRGALVTAETTIATRTGRHFAWSTFGIAGTDGAMLRVPYATGLNGACSAAPYVVRDGLSSAVVRVSEADILWGGTADVTLATSSRSRSDRGSAR